MMRRTWIGAVLLITAAIVGSAAGAPMAPPINVANVGPAINPNGLTMLPGGNLFVVTFAPTGEVYEIAGGAIRNVRRLPAGGLDGVEAIPGGAFLISSWGASAVFQLARDGTATTVVGSVPSPADIGYDNRRDRVLIPIFTENRLVLQPLR